MIWSMHHHWPARGAVKKALQKVGLPCSVKQVDVKAKRGPDFILTPRSNRTQKNKKRENFTLIDVWEIA